MTHVDDLRGLGKLAVDATAGVTDLVQAMHGAAGGAPARLLSAPAYASIRGITSLVGLTLDRALALLTPLVQERTPSPERELLVAVLNGVLGDYLAETKNPLTVEMRLLHSESARVKPEIVVFVHGSSLNHRAWESAPDSGFTPTHLEYNTGLHVSTNGRALDALLETLVTEWPVPVEAIAIVAHSMGGLLARSACYYADTAKRAWRAKLRAIVFLGTPHHGAPLERAGNWLETLLGMTRYSAPFARLGRIRSAGVTDLRFGNVIDEHWHEGNRFERRTDARTPVPLPRDVDCYAIAAENDALVPVASAMGEHPDPALTLDFSPARRFVATGVGHVGMLHSPEVWGQIERWLRGRDG